MKRNSDFMRHFMMQKATLAPKLAWQAITVEEHQAWRGRFGRRLRELVGRTPPRVPLQVDWVEKVETEAFTRHKLYIQSEQDYWVPAYLFLPKRLRAAAPAVVCLHGHSGVYPYIREGNEKERAKSAELELDFAPYFAEHGYVTIAPVQRGWNETALSIDRNESGCQRMVLNSFLSGMTPIGLRCWDASRLVDFLQTLEAVDPLRIGVAGLSGGGMVALFWAALEPRIRLAMVAGYYCTFADSIYSLYHCLCNCVPRMLEWGEMRDIAALIAPRPLLIISGTKDPIFPIKATRQAFSALKPVYDLLEAQPNLEKDFFNGPHAWSNRKTLAFLDKHFTMARYCPTKASSRRHKGRA
jgi:dienelactone hydrolase